MQCFASRGRTRQCPHIKMIRLNFCNGGNLYENTYAIHRVLCPSCQYYIHLYLLYAYKYIIRVLRNIACGHKKCGSFYSAGSLLMCMCWAHFGTWFAREQRQKKTFPTHVRILLMSEYAPEHILCVYFKITYISCSIRSKHIIHSSTEMSMLEYSINGHE